MEENKNKAGNEDQDLNNSPDHDAVEAGRKAIEAGKIANDKEKPKEQKEKEDAVDAEKWRNEG